MTGGETAAIGPPPTGSRTRTATESSRAGFGASVSSMFGSNVAALVLSFVSGVLLARYLGPAGRGTLAALLVVPNLVVSLAGMGVRQAAAFSIARSDSPQESVSAVLGLLIVASVVGASATAIAYRYLQIGSVSFVLTGLLAFVLVPSFLVTSYMGGILVGGAQIGRFSRIRALPEVIRVVSIVALVGLAGLGLIGAVASTVLASVLVGSYSLWLVSSDYHIRVKFDRAIIRRILNLGWMYSLGFFLLQINYRVDVLLLQKLSSANDLGLYAIGVGLVEQLWQLPDAVGLVLFARAANRRDHQHDVAFVGTVLRLAVFVTTVGAGLLAVVAYVFVPIIYGSAFRRSVDVIYAILPGIVAFTAVKIVNGELNGRGRPALGIAVLLPAAALNIALNLLLIPRYGSVGAAFASTMSYTVTALVFCVLFSRVAGTKVSEVLTPRRSDLDVLQNLRRRIWVKLSVPMGRTERKGHS